MELLKPVISFLLSHNYLHPVCQENFLCQVKLAQYQEQDPEKLLNLWKL